MKLNNRLLLTLALLTTQSTTWVASSLAEVVEIKTMREIREFIIPGTFVVFDLDNTVMEPLQTLGSDQWFDYLNKTYQKGGMTAEAALIRSMQVWGIVQKETTMQPVESLTPSLIQKLQDSKFPVMALTARPASLYDVTHKQLEKLGVSFVRTAPLGARTEVISKSQYKDGIVMVGGESKGEVIKRFLEQFSIRPKRIVFVDDKPKHTKTVDEQLNLTSIEHFELRYGSADPKVAQFNPKIADFQWKWFLRTGEIISDYKARKLLGEVNSH